jgi:ubiquitin-protein ligase
MATKSIKDKRIHSEVNMLEKLPDGYSISYQQFEGGIKVYLEIDKKIIQSELLPDEINTYRFTILLDQDFPFKGPQVQ